MNPLNILSMQTIGNTQFDDTQIDYNAVYVAAPSSVPHLLVGSPGHGVPAHQPTTSAAAVPIKTATIGSGRTMPSISDYPDTYSTLAPQSDTESSTVYLAAACGNCARAYGNKLTCSLHEVVVDSLSACDRFASPFNIPLEF